MKNICLALGILAVLSGSAFADELQQLWAIPTGEVKATTARFYSKDKVKVEEIFYFSRPYKKMPVKIFGYYCYPQYHPGKIPAILLVHGGGGGASLARAMSWAGRGYAVLAIDLPGKGENRIHSRSSGPDMIVANLMRTQPDPGDNYLVHAVAAARNGISYLSQREEVNPARISMVGLSWGGVITLLTNGQDDRLKAAVNVFGAGYIPEGCTWGKWFTAMSTQEKETWNNLIDPKNFLSTQHAPILFITGTNDHCYYLTTFQKSYAEVTADKCYYLIPNLRHRFFSSAQIPALAWIDKKLKKGGDFPQITELPIYQKGENKIIIPVKAPAESIVHLYYSAGGPQQWTINKWRAISPYPAGEIYSFSVPVRLLNPEIIYFVSIKDRTSSLVRSLFKVKMPDGSRTFALSAPVKKMYSHEPPLALLNGPTGEVNRFTFSKEDNTYRAYLVPKGFTRLKSGK